MINYKIERKKQEEDIRTFGYVKGFRFIFQNIRQFFRNRKYAKQRVRNGFCAPDTWEMDYYLTNTISAMLEHLAEHGNGYASKVDDSDYGFTTYEEWEEALRECAYKLYYSSPEHDNDEMKNKYEEENTKLHEKWTYEHLSDGSSLLVTNYTEEDEELSKKYIEEEARIWKLKEQYKNEALNFITKYWYSLWD